MICSKCGIELDEGASFCGSCGYPVSQTLLAVEKTTVEEIVPASSINGSVAPEQYQSQSINSTTATLSPAIPEGEATYGTLTQAPAVAPRPRGGAKATASLVLGVLCIIGVLIPVLAGLPMGITAVVLGSMTVKSDKKGFAIAGIMLGFLGILLSLFVVTLDV